MIDTGCPTCKRTYGQRLSSNPQRCGCCLTGLSLDGRPVFPSQAADGTWHSPITGGEVIQLSDGTWTFLLPEEMFGSRESQIEAASARRAAGEW